MAGKIFINYRRGDDSSAAHALVGRLEQVFPPEQLFMDVDNIEPGLDFVRVLNDQVAQCDVLISIIGRNWLEARDENGGRRLDNPDDFVRIEIETALQQDKRVIPVLVGQTQMPRSDDLPEGLRPLARRNAVRLSHERFRSDVQGLIKALRDGLKEIEAQRDAEAEAKRQAQAEEERKRREADAARQAAEEERRRLAEAEAVERAAAERKRQQAEATQRAEAEQAFGRAKRAGTILALDSFLTTHGTSAFAEEAQVLRVWLVAREVAFRDAVASDDPAVLRSFIATYVKGPDVDQVRRRLRRLGIQGGWQPSAALMIPAAFMLVLAGSAGAYWFAMNPKSSANRKVPAAANVAPAVPPKPLALTPAPDQVAWDLLKDTTDTNALKRFMAEYPATPLRKQAAARLATLEAAQPAKPPPTPPDQLAWQFLKNTSDEAELKRFIVQYPNSALHKDAEARIAALEAERLAKLPPPRPDQVTWSVLKETTDTDALKRFIARYPDSTLRKEAEGRIAALEAAHAVEPPAPTPEEIAWNLLKDSNDLARLQHFVEQFPASKMRTQAEERIAALTAPAPQTIPLDSHALTLSLQSQLKRVGCFDGAMSGEFDAPTRAAERTFAKLTSISLPDALSPEAVDDIRKFDRRVCPLVCPEGQRAKGERCISSVPQKPQQRKVKRSKAVPRNNPSLDRPPPQPGFHRRIGPHYIVTKNGPCLVNRRHPASSCQ